jgi:hypothetical protein
VWHASIGRLPSVEDREKLARKVLDGVGHASLGEWVERGHIVHLRRRLTDDEARDIGPVVDIRGTDEAYQRMAVARLYLPTEFVNRPPF